MAHATADPVVGDSVRYTPERAPRVAAETEVAPLTVAPAAPRVSGGIRGRVGVRYLSSSPTNGAGPELAQPAFDVRLDGAHVGGSAVGIAVDVRAQRSFLSTPGAATAPVTAGDQQLVARAYQAALTWNPIGSITHVTIGRQFAAALDAAGPVDGIAADRNGARWNTGLVAGLQPEPSTLGLSGDIHEYGAYVQAHNRPGDGAPWSLTLAGIGSYDRGQINREFLSLRATYVGRRVTFFGSQDLDVNRGWRSTQEGSVATPTATFAIASVTATDWLSFDAGVDHRRNVWLYRDYVNPEVTFDDAFREGLWGGATASVGNHLRFSADERSSSGGSGGSAQSTTGAMSLTRLTAFGFGVRARLTHFSGDFTTGNLQSGSVELNPFDRFHLSATAGRRTSQPPGGTGASDELTWTSVDADTGIGRSVYLMLSISRESGTSGGNAQSFLSLSYRF